MKFSGHCFDCLPIMLASEILDTVIILQILISKNTDMFCALFLSL